MLKNHSSSRNIFLASNKKKKDDLLLTFTVA